MRAEGTQEVARGGAEGGGGGGKSGVGGGGGNRRTRGGREVGGEEERDIEGDDEMGKCGGPGKGGFWGGSAVGRSYVTYGGTDTQGGRGNFSIGLVEVVWMVVPTILNFWLTASITYHDLLQEAERYEATVRN